MSQTLLTGATVLSGPELAARDAAMLLDGDRIAAVGPERDMEVAAAERVDASGLLIAPGFIDAHVHIGFYDPIDVVRGGVTTVRDLAWPPTKIWALVRRSAADDFEGPTIFAAGQMLTVEGGYPTRAGWAPRDTGRVVGSPAQARAAVTDQAEAGACVVKVGLNAAVGPTLDSILLEAIVDAAHERGLKVTGHTYGLDELTKALDAGMDELAHMLMSPEKLPTEIIARMVAQGMTVVPTLAIFRLKGRRVAIDNLERFLASGGRAIYGTDLGNQGPRPGIDRRETKALASAGMSSLDILRSATVDSAAWLELESVGVIEPGAFADLVALPVEGLEDAGALTRAQMVWRRGRRVR